MDTATMELVRINTNLQMILVTMFVLVLAMCMEILFGGRR